MNCRPAARLCGAFLAVTLFCAAPSTSEAQLVYDFWTSMFGPYNYNYNYGYTGYSGYGYTGYGYSAYSPSYTTAWYPSTGWYSSGYAGYSAGYIGDSCDTCGTSACGSSCYSGCSPCSSGCSPCGSSCSPCSSGSCGYACADGSCASGDCASGDCGFQPPTSRSNGSSRDLQPTPATDAPPRTYDEEPRRNPIDEGFSPRRNDRPSEKDAFPGAPPTDEFSPPETEIRRRPMAPVNPPKPEADEVTRQRVERRLAEARPLNLDARQTAWQPVAERTRLHARAVFSAPRVARVRTPLNQGWTAVAKQPAPRPTRTAGSRSERPRMETSRLEVAGRRTR